MSVLIKGMEMPQHGTYYLAIGMDGKARIGKMSVYADLEIGVYDLIPVPQHGRLIDADALLKPKNQHVDVLADEWYVTVRTIETAPTIIPADKDINVLGKEEGE